MADLSQLRSTLESLQEFQLPEKFSIGETSSSLQPSPTSATECTTSVDPTLLQRYQQARDRYLKYRLGEAFYSKLANGSNNQLSTDDDETYKEKRQVAEAAAKERLDQLRMQVQQRFQGFHQQRLELNRNYAAFLDQRKYLEETIHELENDGMNDESMDCDDDDNDDVEIDDEAMALEEERIKNLTKQKEEMQAQLQSLKEETTQLKVEAAQSQVQLQALLRQRGVMDVDSDPDESVAAIEAENQELQRKLQQAKEMISWNEDMCAAFEHFGGVKILSVVEKDDNPDDILLTLELLQNSNYTMRITLRPKPDKKNVLQVIHATFLPPSQESTISLPNLDALVQYTRTMKLMQVKEDLRFVVREAMMQIRVAEARATELAILFAEFPQVEVSQILGEPSSLPSLQAMESWQVVACKIYENVVATLRLSPECPLAKGSVYLDRLSDIADTNGDEVMLSKTIKPKINAKKFMSPVSLMQAVREELVMCDGKDSKE